MTRDEQELLLSMLETFIDSGEISQVLEFVRGGLDGLRAS